MFGSDKVLLKLRDNFMLTKVMASSDYCPAKFELKENCNNDCEECWNKALKQEVAPINRRLE
jgi:hypothetical protein